MNRRTFLQSSSSAALGTFLLPVSLPSFQDPVKIAILGTGWWGTDIVLKNALAAQHFEIVGLCDVDSVALNRAAKVVTDAGGKQPALFSDYRELYKIPGLQAVAIVTPTHWHALHFIDACKAGLHVFLEKPISYDIREGQAMIAAHRKAQNVVIVDFPRMMLDVNDQVKDFIQSGEAGKILQVQANIFNPEGNLVEKPVRDTIDFETYCGPAPRTKFLCSSNGDKPNWRGIHNFSRGILADWGIHYMQNIRKVMDLNLPDRVSSMGSIVKLTGQDHPDHLEVRFDYGALPVHWSHKTWGYVSPNPERNIGVYYFGEKATIFANDAGWEVYNGKEKIVKMEPAKGDPFPGAYYKLMTQFAEGVRAKSNTGITNTLEEAFKVTAAVTYADLSYQTKAPLDLDTTTMNVKNNKAAQALLQRKYRAPYRHPYNTKS